MSSIATPSDQDKKQKNREYCREWYKRNADKQKEYQRNYRNSNKRQLRSFRLHKKYGLSQDAADAMLRGQGGCCAICKAVDPDNSKTGWHVDHCHSTNVVRGILCHHCNLMLGNARDSTAHLEAAITYLRKSDGG